jgi:hypothetical protein
MLTYLSTEHNRQKDNIGSANPDGCMPVLCRVDCCLIDILTSPLFPQDTIVRRMTDVGSANPGGHMAVLRQVECRLINNAHLSSLFTGHDPQKDDVGSANPDSRMPALCRV